MTKEAARKSRPILDSALNQIAPGDLYRRCLTHEQELAKLDLGEFKLLLAKAMFFGRPLFGPPTVDELSVMDKQKDFKIRAQLWQAANYRDILEVLRKLTTREDRLFLIAWWLTQEKVCEPEDILGLQELRKMAKKRFGKLSSSDFHHADRVRAWLPYFDKLLHDPQIKKGSVSEIVELGYEETAAQAAISKRSLGCGCMRLAGRARFFSEGRCSRSS